jgi:hypothetical protein
MTTKILILYYSMYGHAETLARAIFQGAGDFEGVKMAVKRVPETVPDSGVRETNRFHCSALRMRRVDSRILSSWRPSNDRTM